MALFFETIRIVLPVFLVIALGFLLRRMGLYDDAFTRQTNRLVYLVFLPILLFYKISQADFVTDFNGPQVVGSSLAIVCLFAISYAYATLLLADSCLVFSRSIHKNVCSPLVQALSMCFSHHSSMGMNFRGDS